MIRALDAKKAAQNTKTIMSMGSVQEITDFIFTEYKDILPYGETDD